MSLKGHGRSSCGTRLEETHADVINLGEILSPLMTSPGAATLPQAPVLAEKSSLLSDWSRTVVRETRPVNFATIWNL